MKKRKILNWGYSLVLFSSNMKHSSAKKELKDVKSKYKDYTIHKSPSSKDIDLMFHNPHSRNQMLKTDWRTFVPQINEKSKQIKRDLNISDHLYRDASKRRESSSYNNLHYR